MQFEQVLRTEFVFPRIDGNMSLPDIVTLATDAVAQHLLHSTHVREYLRALAKGKGTHCPDSKLDDLVKYVAVQRGEVDKSDPALSLAFHEKLIMPVFAFERETVFSAVQNINDITYKELQMFLYGIELGGLHDKFWARWFREVVVPYQSLDKNGRKHYETQTRNTLSQYDYTVFLESGEGHARRVTWAVAFPHEIQLIVDMLKKLERMCTDQFLRKYFKALHGAYACTVVDALESVWANVDRAWIQIPTTNRIIPVHGMESGYEHPFCVSPEFRLEVRTAELSHVIANRRSSVVSHALELGLSANIVDLARRKLEKIDISVFTCAVRSGVNLNFRIAGQAVPNRQDILAEGGKIFVNSSTSKNAVGSYHGYLKNHCTPKTYEALRDFITLNALEEHTVDHEFSHPVGCTPESDKAIGGDVKKLLEEGKATMLGLLADEYETSTSENRLKLVALTVARLLRFMQKETLENPTSAAYVRENFVAITTLVESGVMALAENGLTVNLERAQSQVWFEHLKKFCLSVIPAYQACDQVEIRRLTERYCDDTKDPISKVIAFVNHT